MVATTPVLLEVSLKPSLTHQCIAGGVYSALITALWMASISIVMSVLLSLAIVLHGFIYLRCFSGSDIEAIRSYQDGWRIKSSGQWQIVRPAGQAIVNARFIFLVFKMDGQGGGQRTRVMIFSDSGSAADLHALRLNIVLKSFGGNPQQD